MNAKNISVSESLNVIHSSKIHLWFSWNPEADASGFVDNGRWIYVGCLVLVGTYKGYEW